MVESRPRNRRVALVSGADVYVDPQLSRLKYAVSDAKAIAEFLKGPAGYDRVELLVSGVTEQRIVDTAVALVQDLGPGDLFLFYFSGHGIEYVGQHLLLCPDVVYDDFQFYKKTVPVDYLRNKTTRPALGPALYCRS